MDIEYIREIFKNRLPNKLRLEILNYISMLETNDKNNNLIINKLEQDNKELREEKESLKCCGNCKYQRNNQSCEVFNICIRGDFGDYPDEWQAREDV